ncbi:hypothetical protein KKB44_05895 [Candidatus Micrarchaeota archaeon]|nr:hypothetical protein [Candidatus Micrarchaeota archaeon]
MRLTKEVRREGEDAEPKSKFAKFKENAKATSIAALAVAAIACGGENNSRDADADHETERDADDTYDADDTMDADDTTDETPCSLFGEGHVNRILLGLGNGFRPDCEDYGYMFMEMRDDDGTIKIDLVGFNTENPSSSDWKTFLVGVPRNINVPHVGITTIEVCETSGDVCKFTYPNIMEGDINCTVTLAASRQINNCL